VDERSTFTAVCAPGTWWLAAGAPAYAGFERRLELAAADSPLHLDVELAPEPWVGVRLIDPRGSPIDFEALGWTWESGLVPVATSEPPGPTVDLQSSRNERNGVGNFWQAYAYRFVELPADAWGVVILHEEPPLFLSLAWNGVVLDTRPIERSGVVLDLTLDVAPLPGLLSSLRMRLVDADTGSPLPGSVIPQGPRSLQLPRQVGPDGRLELKEIEPGSWALRITSPDHELRLVTLDLAPGETRELGDVALHPAVAVQGHVLGLTPERRAEVRVGRFTADGALAFDDTWLRSCEPDGRLLLDDLPAGTWVLQAALEAEPRGLVSDPVAMSPNVLVDTTRGPVDDVELQLVPVSHVTVRWDGPHGPQLRLLLLDERGWERRRGWVRRQAPERVALPPGRWTVRVLDGDALVAERTFDLGLEPLTLDLALDVASDR